MQVNFKGKPMKAIKTTKNLLTSTFLATTLFGINANAIDLNDMVDKALGSVTNALDKKFNNLFSDSLSLGQACYNIDKDLNLNNLDICQVAGELDNLNFNICSLIGGTGNKNISPISGAKNLCNNKAREFEDIISKTINDVIENSAINSENLDFNNKLSNGKTLRDHYKSWDLNNILKEDSVVSNYLKNGNTKAISVFMDYSKVSKKEIKDIKVEDLKAPETMEDYKRGVIENSNSYKDFLKSTNLNGISSLAKSKMQNNQDKASSAKEVVEGIKKEFDLAKNAEIAYTLANSNYKKIPIPTQEYVKSLRIDLQPEAIAEIRKQQAYESAVTNQITEKWERKYTLAKLLADKEAILAQEFDEASAKAEIEQIVASAGGNSGGSSSSFFK